MRKIILLASALAMTASAPALAQGNGNGKGNGKAAAKMQKSTKANSKVKTAKVRTRADLGASARLDGNNNGVLDRYERDSDRDGIPDYRDGLRADLDRNGNGVLDRYESGRAVAACPPGLAKKTPACIPPGQAKKRFAEGQRLPTAYRYLEVPERYRSQIDYSRYDNDDRFYYDENQVYVVDPQTRLIRDVIDLIL